MKKFLFFALCALSLTACADDKRVITFASLPEAAQTIMAAYVNPDNVLLVTQEGRSRWAEYEVRMNDQSQWEFDAQGALEKVEILSGVPEALVPTVILNHVRALYPNAVIIEYTIDTRDQEIKLNNGIELTYDKKGNLLQTEVD
ncbi:MAG: PepSY-like domain-containing protein [Paludibacteraceae bacterium]|nr:PepSY-like domain-containing protein [Paludibacteraceae bacterium]